MNVDKKDSSHIIIIGIFAILIIFGLIIPTLKRNQEKDFEQTSKIEELEDRIYLLTGEETLKDNEVVDYISLVKYMQDEYGIYSKEHLDRILLNK